MGYLPYTQPGVFTNSSVSFIAQHTYFPSAVGSGGFKPVHGLPAQHVSVTPPRLPQRLLSAEHSGSVTAGTVACEAAGAGTQIKGSNIQSGSSVKHIGCCFSSSCDLSCPTKLHGKSHIVYSQSSGGRLYLCKLLLFSSYRQRRRTELLFISLL